MLALDLVCLALAALIGFATHRASLCNVKAVVELLEARRARMLASLLFAVLWAAAVAGSLALVLHWPLAPLLGRTPAALAVAGGYVFGVGAALNGGCSLSTLQRLADGESAMAITLAGLALGVLLWTAVESLGVPTALSATASPWLPMRTLPMIILVGLWVWVLREAARLWRRGRGTAWTELLRAPSYRLSAAAAVLGIAGGLLYGLQGSWTYTYLLREHVASSWAHTPSMPGKPLLALAALAGMLASSVQRRSFALRLPSRKQCLTSLSGGMLMGVGAALLPGGNDTLLLTALPALSISALASYAALLAGIASAHLLMRPIRTKGALRMRARVGG